LKTKYNEERLKKISLSEKKIYNYSINRNTIPLSSREHSVFSVFVCFELKGDINHVNLNYEKRNVN